MGYFVEVFSEVFREVTPCKIWPFEGCSNFAVKFLLTVILSPFKILCYMYNIGLIRCKCLYFNGINHPHPTPFYSKFR